MNGDISMTPERLEEIRQFINTYGPANCWTGTVGTACTYIHELLKERKMIQCDVCLRPMAYSAWSAFLPAIDNLPEVRLHVCPECDKLETTKAMWNKTVAERKEVLCLSGVK